MVSTFLCMQPYDVGRLHGAIVAATVAATIAPTGCGNDRPVYGVYSM